MTSPGDVFIKNPIGSALPDVADFVCREGWLLDRHCYDDWESLWDDDATYWVPLANIDEDPDYKMSVVYDNRSRIARRVAQLSTGHRHAQSPRSRLARTIGGLQRFESADGLVNVGGAFVLIEQRSLRQTTWAGHYYYSLRPKGDSYLISRKIVDLVQKAEELETLGFIL